MSSEVLQTRARICFAILILIVLGTWGVYVYILPLLQSQIPNFLSM
jgi:hypothetical protein